MQTNEAIDREVWCGLGLGCGVAPGADKRGSSQSLGTSQICRGGTASALGVSEGAREVKRSPW